MYYQSTRGPEKSAPLDAVLRGIASDGGLFVLPGMGDLSFDWEACLMKSPLEMAAAILGFFIPDCADMETLVHKAYDGKFDAPDLTPLVKAGDRFILELFHGPTAAFKDVALSMLPQLITAGRKQTHRKEETVILTATSGDTGKAALEGFHDVPGTRIIVFYPNGGVSAVQRAQMVTQEGANVKVCAVEGNFDDCQRGVKEAFAALSDSEELLRSGFRLSSANSINIGRLAPQVVYYFIAYAELLKRNEIAKGDKVDFIVPTGNFGDILAGYYAKLLGLPVGRLVCASNKNNVLTDFLNKGSYDRRRPFFKTSSPSMDILVSSNLERLLFLMSGEDTETVAALMKALNEGGAYEIPAEMLAKIQKEFAAYYCDEENTLKTIGDVYRETCYTADPHTAVALYAESLYRKENAAVNKTVVLSTASPFKFPEAVLRGLSEATTEDEFENQEILSKLTGIPVPKGLSGLREKEVLHKDVIGRNEVVDYVRKQLNLEK